MTTPTLPAASGCDWPVDTSCCGDWDLVDPDVQARSISLASQTLYALTAHRVGGCPIIVRPCRSDSLTHWGGYGGGSFHPRNFAGSWFNSVGSDNCTASSEVYLPPPVGRVDAVLIDGVALNPTAYRVDNGNVLVRQDGGTFPMSQNLDKPVVLGSAGVGTFGVVYLNAIPVDGHGAYAAGVLACEFAKSCNGSKCRLPAGVTAIVRQGVSMQISSGAFPGGLTGIREVDTFIALYNPKHRSQQPIVWSPDAQSRFQHTLPVGVDYNLDGGN